MAEIDGKTGLWRQEYAEFFTRSNSGREIKVALFERGNMPAACNECTATEKNCLVKKAVEGAAAGGFEIQTGLCDVGNELVLVNATLLKEPSGT